MLEFLEMMRTQLNSIQLVLNVQFCDQKLLHQLINEVDLQLKIFKIPGLILPSARFCDSKIPNPNNPGPSKVMSE